MKEEKVLFAEAHCDGPCGVYDPAAARIAAEAVLSMTKKLIALECPDPKDKSAFSAYLHDLFWKAAKLCSACKVEVSLSHAEELMDCIKEVHRIFWATKGREVAWYTAS